MDLPRSTGRSLLLLLLLLLLWRRSDGCSDGERNALLEIKAFFTIPGYPPKLAWEGGDCCAWDRVSCDAAAGRVAGLRLGGAWPLDRIANATIQQLYTGNSLNATLFLPFPQLQNLTLSDNNIDGCLPGAGFETWSRLSKLQVLDLSYNNLNESIITSLSAVSSLKTLLISNNSMSNDLPLQMLVDAMNLEVLDLSRNLFSGSFPAIQDWPSIKALSLQGNRLNGTLSTQEICKMKNLEELDLSQNEFTGALPSCVANLTSLTFLDVSYNQFQLKFPSPIFENLTSLAYLSLSNNQLEGLLFLSSFSNHSKLKILELSSKSTNFQVETENPLANPSFQLDGLELSNCNINQNSSILPSFLFSQHDILYIDLSNNHLNGFFPKWLLENNTKLDRIDLRNNSFAGQLILPSQPHANLAWLDASSNELNGELPTDIDIKLPFLQYLNLSKNSFQGVLPPAFSNLRQIDFLDLSNNNLSDHIENAFRGNLSLLRDVYLSNNKFYGSFPGTLELPFLTDMVLDGNQITGEIPASICNNNMITNIDISNNKLTGSIPNCLGRITGIEILNLKGNSLGGSIPQEFCNMHGLQFLDLSDNNILGSIPPCFNLSKLQYLHLSQNGITGPFPAALANSLDMRTIDIRNNQLSGGIPSWIAQAFAKLRVLLLKGNRLGGLIPDEICQLKYLSILDLSHNNISGQIPSCLSNMGSEEGNHYSFQYANFYGFGSSLSLPSYETFLIGNPKTYGFNFLGVDQEEFMTKKRSYYYKGDILNYLSGIDLSFNQLEGHIPQEIGNMNWMKALNLSGNYLTGTIPNSLSNLKDLESLDLSHNLLTGEIPRDLTELHSLAVFSVAYNNLSGATLGTEGQFITFGESSYEGNPNLCGPPLLKSCSPKPPASPYQDGGDQEEDRISLLILFGSFAVCFVLGFWGVMAVLYFKKDWRYALLMAVDEYSMLAFTKIVSLMKKKRKKPHQRQ